MKNKEVSQRITTKATNLIFKEVIDLTSKTSTLPIPNGEPSKKSKLCKYNHCNVLFINLYLLLIIYINLGYITLVCFNRFKQPQ